MSEELGLTVKKEDAPEWYQQTVLKADFADYSPVKGCIVIKHWGYAIWEKIQEVFNDAIKKHGVQNYYFPMLIPESLIKKEAEHFSGFTPEVAWVTHAGKNKLDEKLAIRPTSETIMYAMFSKWLKSYRQLPMKVHQWCNIMRWETKMTKPFLRGREFLWQEGHTVHETKEEAEKETSWALEEYAKLSEDLLAIPVVKGKKTDSDKFAGAEFTLGIESLMSDGKALQMGTSHMLGHNFAKPYEVKFFGRDEKWHFGWQTSWGTSTRLLGGVILTHGDDKGAILPPKVAPIQAVIIPILFKGKEEKVIKKCKELEKKLNKTKLRIHFDNREGYTAGWKFNDWELKGVPLRIEIGPRDVDNKKFIIVRRDTGEKIAIEENNIQETLETFLKKIHNNLFTRAKEFVKTHTAKPKTVKDLKTAINSKQWALIPHCSREECEKELENKSEGGPRIIPLKQDSIKNQICINCKKEAKYWLYWGKSY